MNLLQMSSESPRMFYRTYLMWVVTTSIDVSAFAVGCCYLRHFCENASFLPTLAPPASASKSRKVEYCTYKYFSKSEKPTLTLITLALTTSTPKLTLKSPKHIRETTPQTTHPPTRTPTPPTPYTPKQDANPQEHPEAHQDAILLRHQEQLLPTLRRPREAMAQISLGQRVRLSHVMPAQYPL